MTENKTELIKHAAVKALNGMILLGKCHAECFEQGFHSGIKMSKRAHDQGFITSHGRFVSRSEARLLAIEAGQIKQMEYSYSLLFSEELWSEESGGRFNYCYIRGYYE